MERTAVAAEWVAIEEVLGPFLEDISSSGTSISISLSAMITAYLRYIKWCFKQDWLRGGSLELVRCHSLAMVEINWRATYAKTQLYLRFTAFSLKSQPSPTTLCFSSSLPHCWLPGSQLIDVFQTYRGNHSMYRTLRHRCYRRCIAGGWELIFLDGILYWVLLVGVIQSLEIKVSCSGPSEIIGLWDKSFYYYIRMVYNEQ